MTEPVSSTMDDLVVLLRLPPARRRPEPAVVGKRGGLALAVVGAVLALVGVAVWLRAVHGPLGPVGSAVFWVGGGLAVFGIALVHAARAEAHRRGAD